MCVAIFWRKIFGVTRGWPWQEIKELTALSCHQSAICLLWCLWHPPENCSKGLLYLKQGNVPGQTCFRIIDDKWCRALCPGCLCCLHAKHILIAFSVWWMCVVPTSVALEPVEPWLLLSACIHPPSSVSVHQGSAFSVTQQNLEQCGSFRDEFVPCTRGHLYP